MENANRYFLFYFRCIKSIFQFEALFLFELWEFSISNSVTRFESSNTQCSEQSIFLSCWNIMKTKSILGTIHSSESFSTRLPNESIINSINYPKIIAQSGWYSNSLFLFSKNSLFFVWGTFEFHSNNNLVLSLFYPFRFFFSEFQLFSAICLVILLETSSFLKKKTSIKVRESNNEPLKKNKRETSNLKG